MPFVTNRLATQVPLPIVNAYIDSEDYEVTTAIPALVSELGTFANGDDTWGAAYNRSQAIIESVMRCGAGLKGVVTGLEISAGSGLTLNIAAGKALSNGLLELFTATTLAMSDNTVNYIWFKEDQTFEKITAGISPPTPSGVFIGTVTTSGGAITAVDDSGICYVRANSIYRKTADPYKPGDTPPSNWLGYTKTLGGLWFWNGSDYLRLDDVPVLTAKTGNYTVSVNDKGRIFTNSGASGTIDFTLPAAAAGEGPFTFIIATAQQVNINAGSGDKINSAAVQYDIADSNDVGMMLTVLAIDTTNWVVMATNGVWNFT